jgi:hypothetical protein
MNIIKKHKLISTFLKLKRNVSSFGDISLGGSTVLYTKGLIDRSPKDLDILCSGDEKSLIKLFKFLSEMYPVKNRYYGSYNSNQMEGCIHHFRFMYKNTDVCVFVTQPDLYKSIVGSDGMISVDHILKAKEFYLSKLPTNHPSYKKHNKDITQIKNRL